MKNIGAHKYLHGKVIVLLAPLGNAFQEFLSGTLPKIAQVYDILATHPDVRILIHKPRDDIIYGILESLNLSGDRFIFNEQGSNTQYVVETLINGCNTPPLHPFLWQQMRHMIGVNDQLTVPVNQSLVILIRRGNTKNSSRHILNFMKIAKYLKERYGDRFIIFAPSYEVTFSLVKSLFGRASIILGVHGGAFFNHLLAPKSCHIVEYIPMIKYGETIKPLDYNIIWMMSHMIEQTYWRVHEKTGSQSGDIVINVDNLKLVLDKVDRAIKHNSIGKALHNM